MGVSAPIDLAIFKNKRKQKCHRLHRLLDYQPEEGEVLPISTHTHMVVEL